MFHAFHLSKMDYHDAKNVLYSISLRSFRKTFYNPHNILDFIYLLKL